MIPGGPQIIPSDNILPFFSNTPPPTIDQFDQVALTFTELDLSIPTQFRQAPSGITQSDLQNIVKNPNNVIKGDGGTANTAFLTSSTNPEVGNAPHRSKPP